MVGRAAVNIANSPSPRLVLSDPRRSRDHDTLQCSKCPSAAAAEERPRRGVNPWRSTSPLHLNHMLVQKTMPRQTQDYFATGARSCCSMISRRRVLFPYVNGGQIFDAHRIVVARLFARDARKVWTSYGPLVSDEAECHTQSGCQYELPGGLTTRQCNTSQPVLNSHQLKSAVSKRLRYLFLQTFTYIFSSHALFKALANAYDVHV